MFPSSYTIDSQKVKASLLHLVEFKEQVQHFPSDAPPRWDTRIMSKSYKHLCRDERVLLAAYRQDGLSIREVARRLGRSPSTISRELKRNRKREHEPYRGPSAQWTAATRWSESHRRPWMSSPELQAHVSAKLEEGWAPEQISGRLRVTGSSMQVSHEMIYRWVYHEAPDMTRFLVRAHPRRLPRHCRKQSRMAIPARVSIHKRPASVSTREEAGHWEVDTVSWRIGHEALLVAAERKTRYMKLKRLPGRQERPLRHALVSMLRRCPASLVKILIYDKGPENVGHTRVNRNLGTQSYFCDP